MNTTEILINANIRPSVQRLQIYQYLVDNPIHPTVDMVYSALSPTIPTLSKTTVYNTLKLFEEHNLIQTIIIEENELRFDANVNEHIHFKCTKCKQVYDIFTESNAELSQTEQKDFIVTKKQTYLWGICKNCQ